jgi:pantothenate kinase
MRPQTYGNTLFASFQTNRKKTVQRVGETSAASGENGGNILGLLLCKATLVIQFTDMAMHGDPTIAFPFVRPFKLDIQA